MMGYCSSRTNKYSASSGPSSARSVQWIAGEALLRPYFARSVRGLHTTTGCRQAATATRGFRGGRQARQRNARLQQVETRRPPNAATRCDVRTHRTRFATSMSRGPTMSLRRCTALGPHTSRARHGPELNSAASSCTRHGTGGEIASSSATSGRCVWIRARDR